MFREEPFHDVDKVTMTRGEMFFAAAINYMERHGPDLDTDLYYSVHDKTEPAGTTFRDLDTGLRLPTEFVRCCAYRDCNRECASTTEAQELFAYTGEALALKRLAWLAARDATPQEAIHYCLTFCTIMKLNTEKWLNEYLAIEIPSIELPHIECEITAA